MNKRKFVIAAVAVTAAVVIVVIVCLLNIKKADNSETKEGASYYLLSSPSNILCPEATNTAYSNDFIYYGSSDGLIEYDLLDKSFANIKIDANNNEQFSCYTMSDGNIYAIQSIFNETLKIIEYSIVNIDYNSGEVTEIYSPDSKDNVIGCMTLSCDGKMYFIEGSYDEKNVDSNGFNEGYSLFEYDLTKRKKNEILKANTYYILDDKIYFTKLHSKTDTERLFYCDLSDVSNTVDTGIDVGSEISEDTPYMYYPYDNKVYYSNNTNKLMCYDINNGTTEVIHSFDEKSYVRYFQFFNDKMIIMVREPMPETSYYQYGLYSLDADGNIKKLLDDTELNRDYDYNFEWIDYMTVFNGCNDYFIVSTYNPNAENIAYLVDKNYNFEKIVQDGEWNYEEFARIQSEMNN